MASDAMLYQIKVTLNGVRPPIWRRLLVPGSLSLKDLHDVLQVAVGWTDSHLHQFVARGTLYGRPDPEFGRGCVNEKGVRLDGVLKAAKDAMTYESDFGDGWQHKWLGDRFEPERFDIAEANSKLARMKLRGPAMRSGAAGRKRRAG